MIEIILNSEEDTELWGEEFGRSLKVGDTVALKGDLGAGKTFISRAICKGLGYKGHVHSPSYALINEYENTPPIFHMDLYRLSDNADLEEIGVEWYRFNEAICLIEWPERLGNLDLRINYTLNIDILSESSRRITIFN